VDCIPELGFAPRHALRVAAAFSVIAFFTGREDAAHISFLHEAVR